MFYFSIKLIKHRKAGADMGTELAQSIKKTENGQPEAATEGRTGTRQTGTGATGWKTEVKAELKAHRGRLIVCALIGILLLAFLISHKNVFEEPWGTNINLITGRSRCRRAMSCLRAFSQRGSIWISCFSGSKGRRLPTARCWCGWMMRMVRW